VRVRPPTALRTARGERSVVLDRLQSETRDPLEVATIVSHDRQIMPQCVRADQEIEIADQRTARAEAASVFSKELAGILIDTGECDNFQEVTQSPLAFLGITGVVHTLVEFGERDDRECEALGSDISKSLRHRKLTTEEIDCSIGIHEVSQAHRRGSGRVRMRRSWYTLRMNASASINPFQPPAARSNASPLFSSDTRRIVNVTSVPSGRSTRSTGSSVPRRIRARMVPPLSGSPLGES